MSFARISSMAMVAGIALAQYITPEFFAMWGAQFGLYNISGMNMILGFIGLLVVTSIIAGIYPALYSRRFQPVEIISRNVKLVGSTFLSKLLMTLQFSIAIVVLIAGFVFTQNSSYLSELPMGYNVDRIITLHMEGGEDYDLMYELVRNQPGITAVSGTQHHIGYNGEATSVEVDTGFVEVWEFKVGGDYLQTLGVELAGGEFFEVERSSDLTETVIVNQTYVERFIKGDPIGTLVRTADGHRYVKGVIEDYIEGVWRDYEKRPLIFSMIPKEEYTAMVVQTDQENVNDVFEDLQANWKSIVSDRPFDGRLQADVVLGGQSDQCVRADRHAATKDRSWCDVGVVPHSAIVLDDCTGVDDRVGIDACVCVDDRARAKSIIDAFKQPWEWF